MALSSWRACDFPAGMMRARRMFSNGCTGWGRSTHDPVRLVDFEPETHPCQKTWLRYEYRPALVALGVLPRHRAADRLSQRERAETGFARPPLW